MFIVLEFFLLGSDQEKKKDKEKMESIIKIGKEKKKKISNGYNCSLSYVSINIDVVGVLSVGLVRYFILILGDLLKFLVL